MKEDSLKKHLRKSSYFLLGMIILILIIFVSSMIYIESNRAILIKKLNNKISENIDGTVQIRDLDFTLLDGFPNFTVALKDVEIKDKFWNKYKRTFLKAGEIQIKASLLGLFKNRIDAREIIIKNGKIDFFVDENGISNANIFKPHHKEEESDVTTKIAKFELKEVILIKEDRQRNKLFHFEINSLKNNIYYKENNQGFIAKVDLYTRCKSLAFNTFKGSFVKDKLIKGILTADFSKDQKQFKINCEDLNIENDVFRIVSTFRLGKIHAPFHFEINSNIKWKNAADLLTDNINSKLHNFDLQKPLKVNCKLDGDFNVRETPKIIVNADVFDDDLNFPDGSIKKCSFHGEYNNHYEKGKGNNNPNSIIILTNLIGNYENLPFSIPVIRIQNLKNPVGSGRVTSAIKLTYLKDIVNDNYIIFKKGNASVNLDFKVDIENFKLTRPLYSGNISIKDGAFVYAPKNIELENTDMLINFTHQRAIVEKIKFRNKSNIISGNFTVDNYGSLYNNRPENVLINCNLYSPNLDVEQMVAMLISPKRKILVKKRNSVARLFSVFEKSQIKLKIGADKIKYQNLHGSNASTTINLKDNALVVESGHLTSCDGLIIFSGRLIPINKEYELLSTVKVSNVNICKFLKGFNNFGIKSFSPQNIKGNLNLETHIKGNLSTKGKLIENSLKGDLELNVKNGGLVNFGPIKRVGKFMPRRDFNNVVLHELKSKLNIEKNNLNIQYLRLSSSIINIDMSGIYSFGDATNLAIAIPLRNPKDDYNIKDKNEREKLRYKGPVLRLYAIDINGEIKLRLGRGSK